MPQFIQYRAYAHTSGLYANVKAHFKDALRGSSRLSEIATKHPFKSVY